jgi:hypothetical protein
MVYWKRGGARFAITKKLKLTTLITVTPWTLSGFALSITAKLTENFLLQS